MSFRKIQTTNLTSTETSFSDPVIVLGKDNTAPSDIGFLGKLSVNTYSGLVRDFETQKFYLIDNYTSTDSNNSISPISSDKATLVVGALETESFIVPNGIEANRPSSPAQGQLYFNTSTKMFEGFNGTAWVQLVPSTYTETP